MIYIFIFEKNSNPLTMKKLLFLLAITFSTASYSQLTDANFQNAINTCLTTNPDDGMCTDSEYGAMPDWDVSNVTDMSNAFYYRINFNGDISNWDVSNVTNMTSMVSGAFLFNQDISSWNVSKVTNMNSMFNTASSFNKDISTWEVSSVTNMNSMFYEASSFNKDISIWDVSSVADMQTMFLNATAFNKPIGDWNISKVNKIDGMFFGASDFNQPIDKWDVSNVTDMSIMFLEATAFNGDISNWDVSNVTDMYAMFADARSFNQNISEWCVTNIVSEPTNFSTDSPLSESNKPVWGTCPTAGLDNQNQLDISIYPNPTSDMVYIDGNYSQLKVVVYDILGKEILNKSITNSIDISHLDNGVYILQLSDGVKLTTQRIIKN